MRVCRRWLCGGRLVMLVWLLSSSLMHEAAVAASPGQSIIPDLQDQLGLSEQQVRGALGALLVFVREELPKPAFDELARTIPNAQRIMQEAKSRGIVTRPLDDIADFEASLSSIGIGQPLASQFAPAVVQSLANSGHTRERDILVQALN
jgi:hypothetical protein